MKSTAEHEANDLVGLDDWETIEVAATKICGFCGYLPRIFFVGERTATCFGCGCVYDIEHIAPFEEKDKKDEKAVSEKGRND